MFDWLTDNGLMPFLSGLLEDNSEAYPKQLSLWTDFNIACLAVLQKQKDLTQDSMKANTPLPNTCLSLSEMETFGGKLVAICDRIQKHGLVDYEVGVWEEEILSGEVLRHIMFCLHC
ncbi:hypothetical protein BJX96DRAFT_161065 [Aspergillus floccosus]